MPKICDMKEGDLFRFKYRICTISQVTRIISDTPDVVIQSLTDGWIGFSAAYKDEECEAIEMPKTPLELLMFIREHQIKYDISVTDY